MTQKDPYSHSLMDAGWIMRVPLFAVATIVLVALVPSPALSEPKWIKQAIESAEGVITHDNAEAVTLYRSVEIQVGRDGASKSHVRTVVRMLSPNGEKHCDLEIPTYPDRTVHNLRGWWIKSDGKSQELDDENVARWAPFLGTGYYDDHINLMASFHNVSPGDVVAYEYDVTDKEKWGRYYMRISVQVQQPVLYTEIRVDAPGGWEVRSTAHNIENIQETVSGDTRIWTIGKLDYQPDEPLSPPWALLERRLSFTWYLPTEDDSRCFRDWGSVARWLKDMFDRVASQDDKLDGVGSVYVSDQSTCFDRVESICRFVRDEIRYVAVEIGEGKMVPRPPSTTLANRYGDCKDKAMLTDAMLAQQGIECSPVLVPVGTWIDEDLPSPFQFNHVIVGIKYDSCFEGSLLQAGVVGDWILLDPTATHCEVGELPRMDQGTNVLVAADDSGLHRLPKPSAQDNCRSYYVKCHLNELGAAEGTMRVVDYGLRGRRIAEWRSNMRESQIADDLQKALALIAPGATLDELYLHSDKDSIWLTYRFSVNDYVQQSGDVFLIRPGIVPEPGLPPLPDRERKHPIWFGKPEQVEGYVEWSFDRQWQFDTIDHATDLECGVATMNGHMQGHANRLEFSWVFRSDGEWLDRHDYARAQSFRRKAEGFREGKIILRSSR